MPEINQQVGLQATVCMKVSIGSSTSSDECNDSQIDTPWGYIKPHGAVTDGKSESPGGDRAVEMFLRAMET